MNKTDVGHRERKKATTEAVAFCSLRFVEAILRKSILFTRPKRIFAVFAREYTQAEIKSKHDRLGGEEQKLYLRGYVRTAA